MALRDLVAVYNAANNLEAQLVRSALIASGVEAYVTEDVSQVGTWIGGLIPEIHKPQIWVERAAIERAKPVLDDFECRAAELRNAGPTTEAAGAPIESVCEECGGRASFYDAQRGSVQQCPHCGAYLDVGGEELSNDWLDTEPGDEAGDEP